MAIARWPRCCARAGWTINDKWVERIWQREGLKVPHKQPKRGRLWLADGSCIPRQYRNGSRLSAPRPPTSSEVAPGRTATSRASTLACATSCSTAKSSTLSARPNGWMDNGEPRCIAFGEPRVDEAIEGALFTAVGPGAIAAAVAAEKEAGQQRGQEREAVRRDLEAARYAAGRAFRQYDAADPANRLVTGELEARWNKALARVAEVDAKIAAHDAATVPSTVDPASFDTLAADLKSVWTTPTSDARLKKRIVRTVIHEVIADIDTDAAEIVLLIHWVGGVHTEIRLPRRRRGQRTSTSADVIAAVRQLVLIANDDLIAGILNRNGLVTGYGNRWTRDGVRPWGRTV